MMRGMLLFTLICLLTTAGFGQYYYLTNALGQNPGNLNQDPEYPVGGGLPVDWTVILPPSNPRTWSAVQNIPFAFSFNGTTVTQFKVSNTGILTFDANTPALPPTAIPNTLPTPVIPNQSIVVWGIEGTGSNDNIVTKTFGTPGSRQHWIFFSSYSVPNPNNPSNWGYWSIVLEEGTNAIHIVDQRNFGLPQLTLGLQYTAGSALMVAGSPNVSSQAQNDPSPIDNYYYTFLPGTQPNRDLAHLKIDNGPYASVTGAPVVFTGLLKNQGSQIVTSLQLNYSVNGGPVVASSQNNVFLLTGGTYNYTHPIGWSPPAAGNYLVKIWSALPNGLPDQVLSNDTAEIAITVFDTLYQRRPLYETFTSSSCPPCAQGNANFESALANVPGEYVSIKYQQNFPGTGDPYCTPEAINRRGFYSISAIPTLQIDGTGSTNSIAFTFQDHVNARQQPAFVGLDLYDVYVDPAAQSVGYKVAINPILSKQNLRLYVAVVERKTVNNVATNGETEFLQVMKKMLPDANGQSINLNSGQQRIVTGGYIFNGNYRLPPNASAMIDHTIEHSVEEFTDLAIVAWLQDPITLEVLQATDMPVRLAPAFGVASAVVCDSLVSPSGKYVWTQSGTYLDTIPAAAGNDSIITYTVVVRQTTFGQIAPTVCDSYTAPDGQVYTQSGTYQAIVPNAVNCDSVITINLTVNRSSVWQSGQFTVCGSYTAPDGQVYTQSGNYQAVIPNKVGCDSTIFFSLQVNQPSSSSQQITTCGSYTAPDGQVYTQSGQYIATIPNQAGCDSTIQLAVTINQPSTSTLQVSRCGSYTAPDGQVYTTSGTYQAIIPNSKGCDSVITIQATISPGDYDTIAPTACGSYVAPDGKVYTQSGQYFSVLQNQTGCDSVITVNLTILQTYNDTMRVTACDQYTSQGGITYTQSGNYNSLYTASNGCDSVVVLDLTINKSSVSSLSPTACGSYTAPDGQVYTQSGQYQAIIPNAVGCDSIIDINVTIEQVDVRVDQTNNTLTAVQPNAQYQWMICNTNGSKTAIGGANQQTYSPAINGFYAVAVTVGNCTDTSVCYAFTSVGVSVPEWEAAIYPNPTTGTLVLDNKGFTGAYTLVLRNSLGQAVRQWPESVQSQHTLSIGDLPKGLYWLAIVNKEGQQLLPVVLQ